MQFAFTSSESNKDQSETKKNEMRQVCVRVYDVLVCLKAIHLSCFGTSGTQSVVALILRTPWG